MKKLYRSKDMFQDNEMENSNVRHIIQVYGADKVECSMDSYQRFDDDATESIYTIEGKPGMVVSDIMSIESDGQIDLSLKITEFKESGRETHYEELSDCTSISEAEAKTRDIVKEYTSESETAIVSNMGSTICVNMGIDQFELHQVGYDKYHMVFIDNEYGTPGFSADINMPHTQDAKEKATELVIDLAELGDAKECIFEKYSTIHLGGIDYDNLRADIDDVKDISKCLDELDKEELKNLECENMTSEEVEL